MEPTRPESSTGGLPSSSNSAFVPVMHAQHALEAGLQNMSAFTGPSPTPTATPTHLHGTATQTFTGRTTTPLPALRQGSVSTIPPLQDVHCHDVTLPPSMSQALDAMLANSKLTHLVTSEIGATTVQLHAQVQGMIEETRQWSSLRCKTNRHPGSESNSSPDE